MDSGILESKVDKQSERLYETYRKQMDLFEKSPVAKIRGGLTPYDVYALGKMLESYELYQAICEEEGSLNQLGKIPDIAFDVITVAYGTSIVPIVASIQPIEEERGSVYFKNIKANTTKGNMTSGDVMAAGNAALKSPSAYSSNFVDAATGATSVNSTTHYSFTLAEYPVRRQTFKLALATTGVNGFDDGTGTIYGVGMSGTINYESGAVVVDLVANPGSGKALACTYQVNVEGQEDIASIQTFFDNKPIHARVYALKGSIGLLQSYGVRKRFGTVAEDELAADLVSEINAEIGADLIKKLKAGAVGATHWNATPPSGNYSYFDHKQEFLDKIAQAEATMVGNAGRGTISSIIAGTSICALLENFPGFQKISDGSTLGAHVFGTLNGKTIIRVVEGAVLNANAAIPVWRGTSPFEAAAVYAPFMPLVVTSTLQNGVNPLSQQKAAAVWAGVDVVVPAFATILTKSANDTPPTP